MKVFTGSYVGDGVNDRQVTIGVQPTIVIINGTYFKTSAHPTTASSSFASDVPSQANIIKSINSTGFTVGTGAAANSNGVTYYYVAIQDTGGSDIAVGTYTGNGVNNRAITGLGFTPKVVVLKGNSSHYGWWRTSNLTGDATLAFAGFNNQSNRIKSMDSDGFTLGTDVEVNENTVSFYYFALGGSNSAVGNYTGNGSDNRDISGVGFQPALVWIKSNNPTSGLYRSNANSGDSSSFFGSGSYSANGIQSFGADGFQVGTNVAINENGTTARWFALSAGFSTTGQTFTAKAKITNTTKQFTAKARIKDSTQVSFTAQGRVFKNVKGSLADVKYRGIDVMKWTKDTTANQPTDTVIENVVRFLQTNINITHIGVCLPIDPISWYVTFNPSPRTIVGVYQKWADEIHNRGLGVLHRAVSFSMEGQNGFVRRTGGNRYPAGSLADFATTTFTDDFNRSTLGSNYTTPIGNFTIVGNEVQRTNNGLNAPENVMMTMAEYSNFTLTAKVLKASTSGFTAVAFRMRRNTSQSFNSYRNYFSGYLLELRGSNQLRIEDIAASNLIEVTKTFTAGVYYQVKIECTGTTIKAKVWEDGTAEPGSWDIDFTNSLYSTGSVGFGAETSATCAYDDLALVTPQNLNTWLGLTYSFIINNPTLFKSGDIWAPYPERTEGIFSDSTSFLPHSSPGIQANYTNFFNDLKDVSEMAFAQIGVEGIITGATTNNYSEVRSGWLAPAFFNKQGLIVIDYYLNYSGDSNYTAARSKFDIDTVYAAKGSNKKVHWQEWGTLQSMYQSATNNQFVNGYGDLVTAANHANREAFQRDFYANCLTPLFNEGKLEMFQYWGAWDTSDLNEGLFKIANANPSIYSNIKFRRSGWILAEYFNAGPAPLRTFQAKAKITVATVTAVSFTAHARITDVVTNGRWTKRKAPRRTWTQQIPA